MAFIFSVKAVLSESWEKTKSSLGTFWLFLIVYAVLVGIISGILELVFPTDPEHVTTFDFVNAVFSFVLGAYLQIVWYRGLLLITDGKSPTLKNVLVDTKTYLSYLAGSVVFSLLVVIGLTFFVVPGVYLALRYGFYPLFIAEKGVSFSEAFRKSKELTDGVKKKLLLLWLSTFGVVIAGAAALLIGLLWAIPLSTLAYMVAYRVLLRQKEAGAATPSESSPIGSDPIELPASTGAAS